MMNHEAGRQGLLEIAAAMDEVGLPFVLLQGTALGAYRDHGFPPHEKDIDLGVFQESFGGSVVSLAGTLMRNLWDVEILVAPFTVPRAVIALKRFPQGHVKVDIAGLIPWKGKRFVPTPEREWLREPYCVVHPASLMESWKAVVLWGRPFNLFADVETYLEREYGPEWRTPADDHVSRARHYGYLQSEGIPREHLEQW